MSFLIFQYKAGQLIDSDVLTGPDEPGFGDPSAIQDPEVIGEEGLMGSVVSPSINNPTIDSNSSEDGGSADEDPWWLTNFGEVQCVTNTITITQSPPAGYTPGQFGSWSVINGVGDPC